MSIEDFRQGALVRKADVEVLWERKQTRLWTNMRWRQAESVQARQPLQGVAASRRAAGAAADGRAVREGRCGRRLRARPRGACGAAEHSGLSLQSLSHPTSLEEAHFSMFLHVFLAVSLNIKNDEEGHLRLFSRFWAHSKRCH